MLILFSQVPCTEETGTKALGSSRLRFFIVTWSEKKKSISLTTSLSRIPGRDSDWPELGQGKDVTNHWSAQPVIGRLTRTIHLEAGGGAIFQKERGEALLSVKKYRYTITVLSLATAMPTDLSVSHSTLFFFLLFPWPKIPSLFLTAFFKKFYWDITYILYSSPI